MRRGGSMADAKDRVAASIARARADLDKALADLDHLPSVEAGAVAFAGHALGNYLTVTGGTADLLVAALAPVSRSANPRVARRHQPRHEFDDPPHDGADAAHLRDLS